MEAESWQGDLWPHVEVEKSWVKVFRPINAETEHAPYLPKGETDDFKPGTGMEYNDPHHLYARWPQRSKVKVTRPLNAVTENQSYLQNVKACKSPLVGGGGILWHTHYRPHVGQHPTVGRRFLRWPINQTDKILSTICRLVGRCVWTGYIMACFDRRCPADVISDRFFGRSYSPQIGLRELPRTHQRQNWWRRVVGFKNISVFHDFF